MLFLVVFLVVFLALLPDDFLAVLFFAMALLPPFLRAKCKGGEKLRQRFFATRDNFLGGAFPRAINFRALPRARSRACDRATAA